MGKPALAPPAEGGDRRPNIGLGKASMGWRPKPPPGFKTTAEMTSDDWYRHGLSEGRTEGTIITLAIVALTGIAFAVGRWVS